MKSERVAALDLLKWVAIVTMVIDHCAYLLPESWAWLYIPGRAAFPLFTLVIATHVFRQSPGDLTNQSNWLWLKRMVIFGCIAQPAFTLYIMAPTGDIFFTLALGVALALAYHHQASNRSAPLLFICVLAFSIAQRKLISYGLCGVILPTAFLYALKRGTVETWLLPAAVAFLANLPDTKMAYDLVLEPVKTFNADQYHIVTGAVVAAGVCVAGLWVCRQRVSLAVPAVTRWAYWFYPAHLTGLLALQVFSRY
ncbi:TraX family protein [Pseudomonas putida]|uniref:Conjugal transfer protein TraX n=1 Tax=Pseudomonas putida TaxID=303 RepID=A0A8I1EGT3_PSEPU|nr:TraX family protein [Pseudomonas putida]MBI6885822.1 hypothetical protein [Pseudomonas putida]